MGMQTHAEELFVCARIDDEAKTAITLFYGDCEMKGKFRISF